MVTAFHQRGYCRFPADPALAHWVKAAHGAALADLQNPAKSDWRCGGTWFAGVNALENDGAGAVAASGPLLGAAVSFIRDHLGHHLDWERAQLSCIRPGYPQPDPAETPAAGAYRRNRDAAHVDGLLPIGPQRRRMIREPHAFILGLALTDCAPGAAPLVVWEGSHRIMRAAFQAVLSLHDPAHWPQIDLTDAYHAARRRCFAECTRVALPTRPGEATLLHRLALHGVAPWADGADAPPEGRIIAYFRPELATIAQWLTAP